MAAGSLLRQQATQQWSTYDGIARLGREKFSNLLPTAGNLVVHGCLCKLKNSSPCPKVREVYKGSLASAGRYNLPLKRSSLGRRPTLVSSKNANANGFGGRHWLRPVGRR